MEKQKEIKQFEEGKLYKWNNSDGIWEEEVVMGLYKKPNINCLFVRDGKLYGCTEKDFEEIWKKKNVNDLESY